VAIGHLTLIIEKLMAMGEALDTLCSDMLDSQFVSADFKSRITTLVKAIWPCEKPIYMPYFKSIIDHMGLYNDYDSAGHNTTIAVYPTAITNFGPDDATSLMLSLPEGEGLFVTTGKFQEWIESLVSKLQTLNNKIKNGYYWVKPLLRQFWNIKDYPVNAATVNPVITRHMVRNSMLMDSFEKSGTFKQFFVTDYVGMYSAMTDSNSSSKASRIIHLAVTDDLHPVELFGVPFEEFDGITTNQPNNPGRTFAFNSLIALRGFELINPNAKRGYYSNAIYVFAGADASVLDEPGYRVKVNANEFGFLNSIVTLFGGNYISTATAASVIPNLDSEHLDLGISVNELTSDVDGAWIYELIGTIFYNACEWIKKPGNNHRDDGQSDKKYKKKKR
jgi:hypothetical protein